MSDSALDRVKGDVLEGPAVERFKEELRLYVTARFEDAAKRLGERLGETVAGLAEPGAGRGALVKGLERARRVLGEGRTPLRAALTVGAHAAKDSVKKKAFEAVGGGGGRKGGSARPVVVAEGVDVGVPVGEAYDQWTRFQESSAFAQGTVDIGRVLDRRIDWTAEGTRGTVHGVVTFHPLADDLTRVLLVVEYFPQGLLERLGRVWRAPGRRVRLDLERYRTDLMLRGEDEDVEYEDVEYEADADEEEDGKRDEDALYEDEAEAGEAEDEGEAEPYEEDPDTADR
ncbi:cyclase [Streptomyces sp. NPDC014656]|uniref:cyclase n=1 Tax=Streptomyces sp. NPDC014656 TaxID=3364878 RepID=UPI0036F9E058